MGVPKEMILTMRARRAVRRLAEDPDTLHGVLMLIEQRVQQAPLAQFFGFQREHFTALLTAARNGGLSRYPHYRGTPGQEGLTDWERLESERRKRRPAEGRVAQ